MKKLFQRWLLLFVGVAFLATLGVSYYIHNRLAHESALEILHLKLADAERQLTQTRENLKTVRAMNNTAALAKARAFARIVASDPGILDKQAELEKVCRELDVDELHVSDEKGILIASIPEKYRGYDMGAAKQSSEFLGAITDPEFSLVQEPRPNGILKILFQYAGVARTDRPGLIQIGYRPERLERAMKVADVNAIAAAFRIGNNGILRIEKASGDQDGEKIYRETVNGRKSICLSVPFGDSRLIGSLPEEEMYLSRNSVIRILIIGNLVLFGVIFLLVTLLLQKVVIKGIYSVNDSLEKITDGNLNEKVAVENTPEFNALSNGINMTVEALKRAIESESKRIDAELEMGRTIQTGVLPTDFPDNQQYRLSAAMYTAKEVGGDFYDFFMIDKDRLAILIADVSGKGITAALYMMNSKTLLKELIQTGKSPAEAFTQANLELCGNNQAHMFLTAFLAVLNVRTGELECVNAGHNPPLWKHADGAWEYLKIKHSLVLGGSKKACYHGIPVQLTVGDRLLLYTDGVTEAMGPNREQYGEERLRTFLNESTAAGGELLTALRKNLERFANGTAQSDDITLLTLDFRERLTEES
ncbi:MAG: SpoIIE family protein phosphatase [Victivallaceae bacterium]|nr:SpoIIE family protein phosphatase [Victivallaceae bacterium]